MMMDHPIPPRSHTTPAIPQFDPLDQYKPKEETMFFTHVERRDMAKIIDKIKGVFGGQDGQSATPKDDEGQQTVGCPQEVQREQVNPSTQGSWRTIGGIEVSTGMSSGSRQARRRMHQSRSQSLRTFVEYTRKQTRRSNGCLS